jgi:hypothetical protein
VALQHACVQGSAVDPDRLPPSAQAMIAAVIDENYVERDISEDGQLSREIGSFSDIRAHFLDQLSHHCTMLTVGIADAYGSLLSLGPDRPFASNAVTRGLLEAAADLYWLGNRSIDANERARRTITTYLIQTESTVRQLEQLRDRARGEALDEGISQGWSLLESTAEEARQAGYTVQRNRRAGRRYTLGTGKKTTSALVDDVVGEFLGMTGVNLYSLMSSTAHGEGSGLGLLIDKTDSQSTRSGPRFAYGMDDGIWSQRYVHPAYAVAIGAISEWLGLALPEQLPGFVQACV